MEEPSARGGAVAPEPPEGRVAERGAGRRIAGERLNRARERSDVARRDKAPVDAVAEELGNAREIAGDDGEALAGGFQENVRQAIPVAGRRLLRGQDEE